MHVRDCACGPSMEVSRQTRGRSRRCSGWRRRFAGRGVRLALFAVIPLMLSVAGPCVGVCAPGQGMASCSVQTNSTDSFSDRRLLQSACSCDTSPVGQTCDWEGGVDCRLCPEGTYKPKIGTTTDVQCKEGYCSFWGPPDGESISQCIACSKGMECNRLGCSECDACGLGYYKDFVGVEPCRKCPAGMDLHPRMRLCGMPLTSSSRASLDLCILH